METGETAKIIKPISTAFEEYRQKSFLKQEFIGFPKKIILPFHFQQDLENIYSVAENIWVENFNIEEFKQNLNLYKNNDPKAKQYFKMIRKNGLILKSAYRFTDVGRTLPQEYDSFIWSLGRFNDHGETSSLQAFNEVSERVEYLTKKPVRHGTTSLSEANNRIKWICDYVKNIIVQKESVGGEKENFHKIRKQTRHLMNLYQLSGFVNKQEEHTDTFIFLHKIVDSMGQQLDVNSGRYLLDEKNKKELSIFLTNFQT